MVCVGCVQQWQCCLCLGWLLLWCTVAAPGPVVSAPAAVVQSTAVLTNSSGISSSRGSSSVPSRVTAAAPNSIDTTPPSTASQPTPRDTTELHLPGSQNEPSAIGVGSTSDDSGDEATATSGGPSSPVSDAAEDDDEKGESVVSLVPLFVLLASFLLVIVSCVVVCQRIRNSHKRRFHREEEDYRVQSAAYQLIASDGASDRHSTIGRHNRSFSAANGKCPPLDKNGNLRSTLVKFVDNTGLAATVVTCVQASAETAAVSGAAGKHRSALADRRGIGSSDCRDGCEEGIPLLGGLERSSQAPAADASAKPVGSGEITMIDLENKTGVCTPVNPNKASVGAGPFATAVSEQARKSCLAHVAAASSGGSRAGGGEGGGSGGSSHYVTFADDDVVAAAQSVRKASSLKSVKRSPPPPAAPLRSISVVEAARGVQFHVMDGKSLKVAFLDKNLTVHGPDGRNFKVARLQSLPNSSSANALSVMYAAAVTPPSAVSLDAIHQRPQTGSGIDGLEGAVASRPRPRHAGASNGSSCSGRRYRTKMHSMSSSSPNSSAPSSPRDQQQFVGFDRQLGNADVASQPPQSAAVAAAHAASSIAVKRRDARGGRTRRGNRPLSAAPRLVGASAAAAAGTRAPLLGLRWKLPSSPPFDADESYDPDDGEDTDDSDANVQRRHQRRRADPTRAGKQRQLSSSVVHRVNILDSGGSGSCNS